MTTATPTLTHPLLHTGHADVFAGVPLGVSIDGTPVSTSLMFSAWLLASQPRSGLATATRTLLAAAALDPICDLWIFDVHGAGDFAPFQRVSDWYATGPDAVTELAMAVAKLRMEMQRRSTLIQDLGGSQLPDGRLTRTVARTHHGLRPVVVALPLAGYLFDGDRSSRYIARDLLTVIRLCRPYGIIPVLTTHRPGDLPGEIRDALDDRFCLKMASRTDSALVLGDAAQRAGLSAADLDPADRGRGYLVGGGGDPWDLHVYQVDLGDADTICTRAHAMRTALS